MISPFSDLSGIHSVVIHPTSDTMRPTLGKVKIGARNPYVFPRNRTSVPRQGDDIPRIVGVFPQVAPRRAGTTGAGDRYWDA
jgi:hypothetical protein